MDHVVCDSPHLIVTYVMDSLSPCPSPKSDQVGYGTRMNSRTSSGIHCWTKQFFSPSFRGRGT